jgi:S1-C subfamily serine protease
LFDLTEFMRQTRQKVSSIIVAISFGLTPAVLAIPLSTATEFKLVQNLTPQEVNLRAKQFTVRIDGAGIGTGVIVEQSESTYTVLTNWHVVKQSGEYSVQTIDGRKHSVNYSTVKQLPNLDLAILQFERKQNYQLAEIGDSSNVIEGQNIYFAGYPGELRQEDNRYYRFFPANLVGLLPESTENGYSLIYNGEAFPGMSGGPVLDSQGFLIGIHGEANINAITGGTSNYAIPIARYQASISQVSSSSQSNQPNNANGSTSTTTPTNNSPNPSVIVETNTPEPSVPTATPPGNNQTERPVDIFNDANQSSNSSNPNSSNPNSSNPNSTINNSASSPSSNDGENNDDLSNVISVPILTPSNSGSKPPSSTKPNSTPQPLPPTSNSSNPNSVSLSTNPKPTQQPSLNQQPELLSRTTGIDYTSLKELLAKQEWQQADKETQQLITRIIDTAKRQNRHSFITINAIADYSCRDLRTIDRLWQEYSKNQFGFTPQQLIWLNLQQNNNFSADSWRSFATEIGWKQGELANSGGYLLYEQLTFNPQTAPQGHLPWWFATTEEEQNILKSVFNRCSFQAVEEVEASEKKPTPENQINEPKKLIKKSKP